MEMNQSKHTRSGLFRQNTRVLRIGAIRIGGGQPVSIQSMTNTSTADVAATVAQVRKLDAAGVHIVRLGVPDEEAARAIARIRQQVNVPLVADIHFSHRLALIALEGGVDALRINPGNLRRREDVREVVQEAASRKTPLRIGINGGSLPKDLLTQYQGPTAEAMIAAAEREMAWFEELDFSDYKVSLKSSDVETTVEANLLFAEKHPECPLHLGVTEAGVIETGIIRSAVGLGRMLLAGIGDTVRVSLTADPVMEATAARDILAAAGVAVLNRPRTA